MQGQSTDESTCTATYPSPDVEAAAVAYAERFNRCLRVIGRLGTDLPENDPEGAYLIWYATPTGPVYRRQFGADIVRAAAVVVASEFGCKDLKALSRGRVLFIEVDGYVVEVLPASSPEGRRLLARAIRAGQSEAGAQAREQAA